MAVVVTTPIRPSRDVYEEFGPDVLGSVELVSEGSRAFLSAVLGEPKSFQYLSRRESYVINVPDGFGSRTRNRAAYQAPTVSLGLQAAHGAFAGHIPLSLRPDVLWYFVVHEVAQYVKQNPGRHASVFTKTPESQQAIVVRDDSLRYGESSDWEASINLVRAPLVTMLTDRTMALFLPRFTTSTFEDETALLISLMDTVSPYYKFTWQTMCGIPEVRLEGSPSDWRLLYDQSEGLARIFDGLSGYFDDLLPVLQAIAETADGITPDDDFWRSIYKYSGRSGGPYVNGWITAFFAYVPTPSGPQLKKEFDWRNGKGGGYGGWETNQFPSHVSSVRFVWEYFGQKVPMAFVSGVTGIDYRDSFLIPRLGFAVAEV